MRPAVALSPFASNWRMESSVAGFTLRFMAQYCSVPVPGPPVHSVFSLITTRSLPTDPSIDPPSEPLPIGSERDSHSLSGLTGEPEKSCIFHGSLICEDVGVSNQMELPAMYSSGEGIVAFSPSHPAMAAAGISANDAMIVLNFMLWICFFMERCPGVSDSTKLVNETVSFCVL